MESKNSLKKIITVVPKTVFMNDFYGLSNEINLRVFITLCSLRNRYVNKDNPTPEIHMHNNELEELSNTCHVSFFKAKKFLIKKGLIICNITKEVGHGSICHIMITEKGLSIYYEILNNRNKKEENTPKQKVYRYTEEHLEIAKYWFRQIRRFWKDSPKKLQAIKSWEDSKEERANSVRLSLRKLKITPKEFLQQIKVVINSVKGDFFMQNAFGTNAFTKKWKNGFTVAENISMAYEEIIKQEQIEDKLYIDEEKDLPKYGNENETPMEDQYVSKVWHAMFDVLGNRLKLKYKTVKEANEAVNSLQTICEEIANRLDLAPCRLQIKYSGSTENKNYYVYWLFVQDKYQKWNGIITTKMLWDCWTEFWKKVWRLDHASFTCDDMKNFLVEKYLVMED